MRSTTRYDHDTLLPVVTFLTSFSVKELTQEYECLIDVEEVEVKGGLCVEAMALVDEGGDEGSCSLIGRHHLVVVEPRHVLVVGGGQVEPASPSVDAPGQQVVPLLTVVVGLASVQLGLLPLRIDVGRHEGPGTTWRQLVHVDVEVRSSRTVSHTGSRGGSSCISHDGSKCCVGDALRR